MPQLARARWTPRRIRKATLLPKPVGAIAKATDYNYGIIHHRPAELHALDHRVVAYLAQHADMIDAEIPVDVDRQAGRGMWLLTPAPIWLLEALFNHDADLDGLELDADNEPDHDREPSDSDD